MSQWQPQQYDPSQQGAPWGAPQQPYAQPGYQQPQPQYPPQPPPASPAKAPQRKRPLRGCLTLIVVAVAIGIGISVATSGGGGSGASWKARTDGFIVINPGDIAVTLKITNTGKTAATPTCTVNASDPAGSYTGVFQGTLQNTVQPGRTTTTVANVSVSNNGAQYVTDVSVSC